MEFGNVNPVQRTAYADAVRRQSHPNHKRCSGPDHLPDDDSETEQHAGNGNTAEENDRYQAPDEDESAILRQVTAEELRGPATAAARVLQSRG